MCTVATFNLRVYSKCSMENFPVQPVTPWGNPVIVGVSRSGEANGAGDGTVTWSPSGCREQPSDTDQAGDPPQDPANGQ